jgi:hypothetical protein
MHDAHIESVRLRAAPTKGHRFQGKNLCPQLNARTLSNRRNKKEGIGILSLITSTQRHRHHPPEQFCPNPASPAREHKRQKQRSNIREEEKLLQPSYIFHKPSLHFGCIIEVSQTERLNETTESIHNQFR